MTKPNVATPTASINKTRFKPKKRQSGGFVLEATDHDRLPFVIPSGDGSGRIFWAPRPTGTYSFDCTLGQQYGLAPLPLLREPGGHQFLRWIACDILRLGAYERDRGLLIGMFGEIGKALERPAGLVVVSGGQA